MYQRIAIKYDGDSIYNIFKSLVDYKHEFKDSTANWVFDKMNLSDLLLIGFYRIKKLVGKYKTLFFSKENMINSSLTMQEFDYDKNEKCVDHDHKNCIRNNCDGFELGDIEMK